MEQDPGGLECGGRDQVERGPAGRRGEGVEGDGLDRDRDDEGVAEEEVLVEEGELQWARRGAPCALGAECAIVRRMARAQFVAR